MAVAFESDGGTVFAASASNAAITVPLPATRPVGSVLYLIVWSRLITDTPSGTAGVYTLLSGFPKTSGTASGGRIWVYARVVTGGETAPTVGCTSAVTGNSGDLWGACIFCYSGVAIGPGVALSQTQVDGTLDGATTVTDASGTTTCTYPAQTIAEDNSMLVSFLARFRDAADTFTPTATWNEREDLGSTLRTGAQFHLQDKLATASGSQAAVTVAPSNTTAARYLAVSLALKSILRPSIADTLAVTDSVSVFKPPSGPYAEAVLADSPAAYYRLDETSGLPQDSSGNGNNATAVTGTPSYAQSGAITDGNTAIRLPGTAANRFQVPDHATLDLGDVFTLEGWIKLAATGQYHTIVAKTGVGGAYNLRISNGNALSLVKEGTAVIVNSTTLITDTTTWHHVVATKNGSTVKLYIDGVDVTGTVTNSTCGNSSSPLYLGSTIAEPANATLDEIAIYPTALSAARVSAHYAAATAAPPAEQDVDDTLALSDALTFERQITIADTLALADAIRFDQTETLADTLALADSASAQLGIAQAIPDTVALSDLATTATGKGVAVPDTLALADALRFDRVLVIPDTLALTDALAQAEEIHIGETLALADLCDPVKTIGAINLEQPVADTLGLADALSSLTGRGVSIPDTLGLTDAQAFGRSQTVADVLALADALGLGRGITAADTLGLTDAQAFGFGEGLADTLGLADLLTPSAGKGASIDDTLGLADALRFDRLLTLAETLALVDTLALQRELTIGETLALVDLLTPDLIVGGIGKTQGVSDTLGLADALRFDRGLTVADALGLADGTASQLGFQRTVADTLGLADLLASSAGKGASPADTLALADALRFGRGLGVDEALPVADALAFQRTIVQALTDLLPLVDEFAFQRTLQLLEALGLVDSVTTRAAAAGVILNTAEAVYLGSEPVEAVYAGAVKVWP